MASNEQILKEMEGLKREIEKAKLERAELKGQLDSEMERLRTEFNCRTLDAAKTKLKQLREKDDKLAGEKQVKYDKLRGLYEW